MKKQYTQLSAESLKKKYQLISHVEGGSFSEVYTAPVEKEGRPFAGSIYFLLDAGEISHFHELDCDEIWYYHAGCGMKITVLSDEGMECYLLGSNPENEEQMMVVIPQGRIFAAENLKEDGYTFVSCVTTPKFHYSGFRLISKSELKVRYGSITDGIEYLAYS